MIEQMTDYMLLIASSAIGRVRQHMRRGGRYQHNPVSVLSSSLPALPGRVPVPGNMANASAFLFIVNQ